MPKSKLTAEFIERATALLRGGNYVKTVCGILGVDESTWYKWLTEAEVALVIEESVRTPHQQLCVKLRQSITQASEEAIADAVEIWRKHFPEDYRAVRDFLERRAPERFAKTAARAVETRDETPTLVKSLFDKIKESYAHLLGKKDG